MEVMLTMMTRTVGGSNNEGQYTICNGVSSSGDDGGGMVMTMSISIKDATTILPAKTSQNIITWAGDQTDNLKPTTHKQK